MNFSESTCVSNLLDDIDFFSGPFLAMLQWARGFHGAIFSFGYMYKEKSICIWVFVLCFKEHIWYMYIINSAFNS